MPNPTNNLAGVEWPRRKTCPTCKRVFFAFTAFARYCCPAHARAHGQRAC
jgi:hypothetical protein